MVTQPNTPTTADPAVDAIVTDAITTLVTRARAILEKYAGVFGQADGDGWGETLADDMANAQELADALAGHYGIGDPDPNGDRYAADTDARGWYARIGWGQCNPRDDARELVTALALIPDNAIRIARAMRRDLRNVELIALAETIEYPTAE